ncbi:methionyl-tRNA formyltransferase [Salsipaludibacter albus]|uniref:methionyl-tRNA formyltransferase n=1 Tax=Salsipaludibacter albus TaxID=2849650 RepID=UPI001EE3ABC9|nr:methionyl-tRNA formyltransferase [Salsipaludibacter albus]MBY5163768.1 methionyl-tRNA formyltransferase [Salsipaludibacter albus]
MRLVFFGTPDVAVPSLEALLDADDVEVVAVVTNPDRPRGRSATPRPSAVKQAALAADVPVWQPERGRDVRDDLAAAEPDVCAVVAYGSILPADVLAVPTHGFVNLHFSRLPRWRGAAPVQWAIRAGDSTTGISTFVLDEGMDTGPLLDVVETGIGADETAGELLDRLAVTGAPVLLQSLRDLVDGAVPQPQPDELATYAHRIGPDDVRIDFTDIATAVAALVRSAAPRPGAHTTWQGERFKLLGAVVADTDPGEALPGELVDAGPDGLVIACGLGAIRATLVQPAGKAAMTAGDFANGYQPEPGTRFGSPGPGAGADDGDPS